MQKRLRIRDCRFQICEEPTLEFVAAPKIVQSEIFNLKSDFGIWAEF
jgi:hypothetical protein